MAVIKKSLLELNGHSGRDELGISLTALRKDGCVFKITALPLHALTAAALILPGLFQPAAEAAEDDSINFQYSHYQEGKREGINALLANQNTGITSKYKVPNNQNPIEVDSLHGSSTISLTDRVKFAFNYTQDTWSGATPIGSAPEQSAANSFKGLRYTNDGTPISTGASPFAKSSAHMDKQGNSYYQVRDPITGQSSYLKDRTVHVMSFASPETRKQGDFKLSYQWDEAALDVSGGISIERDYESRFANLGGHMDFNQKQTTVNLGLSYTNSAIDAVLDTKGDAYIGWSEQHDKLIDLNGDTKLYTLRSNRQDWATHLGLTQVVNQDAVVELGMGYTRSTGFLENPYKLSWLFSVDREKPPTELPGGVQYVAGLGRGFIEQRPDERNQFNWSARWVQFIPPMDAALHLGYNFAHDDWGVNAHTFAADWVQPMGYGWTVTPRIRYYSQEAADFYQPFFIVDRDVVSEKNQNGSVLPDNFSSDQRLSGYGTLSGGVTVAKEFAKGIRLETGFEYYTHQGGLKLGGGGEGSFADFDYWVANAALKVNLSAFGQAASGSLNHVNHAEHSNIPAGILFGHTLDKAGDMMVGYRYMRNDQGGGLLSGARKIPDEQVIANGCPGSAREDENGVLHFDGGCSILPKQMSMSMHMLDLMVAPTDWLTLMLMPQFVDMDMDLNILQGDVAHINTHGHLPKHETGGIGDTGMYALVKLFDRPNHHIHASMGFTAPTGDVGIKLKDDTKGLDGAYIHYGMQLGSGTWDFKPSLTYAGKTGNLNWGAQVAGTKRLESRNDSGYALGDLFETSVWGGYDLTHWLSATVRAAYTWQGKIKGRYPRSTRFDYGLEGLCVKADYTSPNDPDGDGVSNGPDLFDQVGFNACLASVEESRRKNDADDRPSPMDFPANYGGHYVDIGLGLSATVPHGALAGNRLSFEWLQPVYTDVNGYQLDRDGALSFTWSYGF